MPRTLGGEYSHGVHKLPARGQIMVHAERGGSLRFADPPASVRALADQAAAAVPQAFAKRAGHSCRMPLYLRIDVIETSTAELLSECEGVEPELFFRAPREHRPIRRVDRDASGKHEIAVSKERISAHAKVGPLSTKKR